MTRRISKEEALRRLAGEPRSSGCIMCSLLAALQADAESERVLERGVRATTVLNAYPLTWGHAMVVAHDHVTSYAELDEEAAVEVMRLIRAAAIRIEEALSPLRVFVASLGSSRADLAMTSPHLHWHLVPVGDAPTRPAEVLTWERGVLEGTDEEWRSLARSIGVRAPIKASR